MFISALLGAALIGPAAPGFSPCNDAGRFIELQGSLCLTARLPLRAPGPAVGKAPDTVELFVRKFPAAGRVKGAVWLVSGGPGESGATFYPFIGVLRKSFPGFDLIIPDHRGTGYSTRLCPKQEAVDSPAGAALEGAEWGDCWAGLNAAPDYARAFSITNAALDLSALMKALPSQGTTYLYGVSYGTQLVLRALQADPPRVDGVILDSLVPPEATQTWDLSRRSEVADKVGREVLRRCSADPICRGRLGGPAEAAYRRLLDSPGAARLVPGGNLRQFFGGLLDLPSTRRRIPDLISELGRGETTALKAVEADQEARAAMLGRYPQSPASIPLVSIISVSENDARPGQTKAEVAAEQQKLFFASPLPGYLVDPGLPLYARDSHFGRLPARLPPTLVLQGALDPKTPLAGAEAQVRALAAAGQIRLVRVADAPHFILMNAQACFKQAAASFTAAREIKAAACDRPKSKP